MIDGLPDEYRAVCDVTQNCDTPISFEEFHDKLRNREAAIVCGAPSIDVFSASAQVANSSQRSDNNWTLVSRQQPDFRHSSDSRFSKSRSNDSFYSEPHFSSSFEQRQPYLSHCQACGK